MAESLSRFDIDTSFGTSFSFSNDDPIFSVSDLDLASLGTSGVGVAGVGLDDLDPSRFTFSDSFVLSGLDDSIGDFVTTPGITALLSDQNVEIGFSDFDLDLDFADLSTPPEAQMPTDLVAFGPRPEDGVLVAASDLRLDLPLLTSGSVDTPASALATTDLAAVLQPSDMRSTVSDLFFDTALQFLQRRFEPSSRGREAETDFVPRDMPTELPLEPAPRELSPSPGGPDDRRQDEPAPDGQSSRSLDTRDLSLGSLRFDLTQPTAMDLSQTQPVWRLLDGAPTLSPFDPANLGPSVEELLRPGGARPDESRNPT